jgi:hypothetical protein
MLLQERIAQRAGPKIRFLDASKGLRGDRSTHGSASPTSTQIFKDLHISFMESGEPRTAFRVVRGSGLAFLARGIANVCC